MTTYVNPLAHAGISQNGRVDEGVDYGVTGGYLVAIGNYRVTYASDNASGWPGGQVQYVLTEPGPLEGAIVYYAEGVTMWKRAGDVGRWGDGICLLRPYWHAGIEIGWGSDNPPDSWARAHGGSYDQSNSQNAGVSFNNLLKALGAPGGVVQGSPQGPMPPYTLHGSGFTPGAPSGPPSVSISTESVVNGIDPSPDIKDIADQWSVNGSRTYNHANDIADTFRRTHYITISGPR